MNHRDWMVDAACRGKSPSSWFPLSAGDNTRAGTPRQHSADPYEYARAICADCPVVDQCREYALDIVRAGQRLDGMWGGLDEQERQLAVHGHKVRRPKAWAS